MSWNDFNDAEEQREFDIIPKNTLVKVRMNIRPGGFDEPSQGWTGGFATRNEQTGAVYLDCEFVVLHGPFARRKIWSLIGLFSAKQDSKWADMGRAFVKGILNSSRGLSASDLSPQAQQARRINGFQDIDGVEFVAKIGVERDQHGDPKNIINLAVSAEHDEYQALMHGQAAPTQTQHSQHFQAAPQAQHYAQPATNAAPPAMQQPAQGQAAPAAPSERPSWAN